MRRISLCLGLIFALAGCGGPAATVAYDAEKCQRLLDRFTEENEAMGLSDRAGNLGQAIGQTGRAIIRIQAMETELRSHGCPTDNNSGEFRSVKSEMATAHDAPAAEAASEGPPERPTAPKLGQDPEPTTKLDDY